MTDVNRVYTGFPVIVTEPSEVSSTELLYLDTALPATLVASKCAVYGSSKQLAMCRKIYSGVGSTLAPSADDSGALIVLDRAAGCVVTLPTQVPGVWFDFIVTVSVTTNAYKVITGAATEFISGLLVSVDTDSTNALAYDQVGNGSSHVAINMAAASSNAKGGLVYTRFRLTCVSSVLWVVEGVNFGGGTVATPFATS